MKALIKQNDWNQVHLIARGNTIMQILNGAVTSVVIDDDAKNRVMSGLIGFQMHTGEPMRVEYPEHLVEEALNRGRAVARV